MKVTVPIQSHQDGARTGHGAVVVWSRSGQGMVIHTGKLMVLGYIGYNIVLFTFQSMSIYLYLTQRHAHSSAHAHLRLLFLSSLNIMLKIVMQQKIDRRSSTNPSDYLLSCPCNKDSHPGSTNIWGPQTSSMIRTQTGK
jgi:hypothetical protein